MKKLIICLVFAFAVSCKKVSHGGNKATLKLQEGIERYSDDIQGEAYEHAVTVKSKSSTSKTDSTTVTKIVQAEETPKAE